MYVCKLVGVVYFKVGNVSLHAKLQVYVVTISESLVITHTQTDRQTERQTDT